MKCCTNKLIQSYWYIEIDIITLDYKKKNTSNTKSYAFDIIFFQCIDIFTFPYRKRKPTIDKGKRLLNHLARFDGMGYQVNNSIYSIVLL